MSEFAFVARFTAQGRVDLSYDQNGYVVHDVDQVDMDAPSVASSAYASHIVVDGRDRPVAFTCGTVVFRLTPDGALDTAFNGSGQVDTAPFLDAGQQFLRALATDSRNRIYVTYSSLNDDVMFRLSEDGQLDRSFANGALRAPAGYSMLSADTLVLDEDDNIYVILRDSQDVPFVAKYLGSTGALDARFGSNGLARPFTASEGDSSPLIGLGWSRKTRTVIAGSYFNTHQQLWLRRLDDATGQVDLPATAKFATPGTDSAIFTLLTVDDTGRTIASLKNFDGDDVIYLCRAQPDGTPDAGFGTAGVRRINLQQQMREWMSDIGHTRQGHPLLMHHWSAGSAERAVLTRHRVGDGGMDAGFGFLGLTPVSFPPAVQAGRLGFDVDSQDRIYVSGRMAVDPDNLWPSLRVVLEKIDYDGDDIGAEWDIGYQVNGRPGSVVLNMTKPGATLNRTLLRTRLDPQERKADGWQVTGLIAPVERDWFFDDIFEIAGFSETLSDFDTPLRRSYDIRVREVSWPIPWPGMAHLRVHLRFELTRAPFT